MPKFNALDKDGNLLAVIEADSENEATHDAKALYPATASVEEREEAPHHERA